MIHLENVRYAYGEVPALNGIDLRIRQGDSVAIVGPNGSGKSTLMKVLVGLMAVDSGDYEFGGQRVDAKTLGDRIFAKNLHRKIGFLFQNSDAQLFCPTVAEELAFGPTQLGVRDEEIYARVADCAALLGIGAFLSKPPYQLSEGEKRKVALAAVLSLNPEVLVLDEPLNSLDPKTKRFLRNLFVSLHSAGKTIIASTHDFSYLDGFFKTAIVLSSEHRVVRVGPYEEIIGDHGFLAELNII